MLRGSCVSALVFYIVLAGTVSGLITAYYDLYECPAVKPCETALLHEDGYRCTGDEMCPEGYKCCRNGCHVHLVCVTPVGKKDDQHRNHRRHARGNADSEYNGMQQFTTTFCPALKSCLAGIQTDFRYLCVADEVCPEGYKCCNSDCYTHRVCVVPVDQDGELVFSSPTTTISATYATGGGAPNGDLHFDKNDDVSFCPIVKPCPFVRRGNLKYRCAADEACPEGYKCCRSDCYVHRVCVIPVDEKGKVIASPPVTTPLPPEGITDEENYEYFLYDYEEEGGHEDKEVGVGSYCPDVKPCEYELIYDVRYRCVADEACPYGYKCCRSDCYIHNICVAPVNKGGEMISPPPIDTTAIESITASTTEPSGYGNGFTDDDEDGFDFYDESSGDGDKSGSHIPTTSVPPALSTVTKIVKEPTSTNFHKTTDLSTELHHLTTEIEGTTLPVNLPSSAITASKLPTHVNTEKRGTTPSVLPTESSTEFAGSGATSVDDDHIHNDDDYGDGDDDDGNDIGSGSDRTDVTVASFSRENTATASKISTAYIAKPATTTQKTSSTELPGSGVTSTDDDHTDNYGGGKDDDDDYDDDGNDIGSGSDRTAATVTSFSRKSTVTASKISTAHITKPADTTQKTSLKEFPLSGATSVYDDAEKDDDDDDVNDTGSGSDRTISMLASFSGENIVTASKTSTVHITEAADTTLKTSSTELPGSGATSTDDDRTNNDDGDDDDGNDFGSSSYRATVTVTSFSRESTATASKTSTVRTEPVGTSQKAASASTRTSPEYKSTDKIDDNDDDDWDISGSGDEEESTRTQKSTISRIGDFSVTAKLSTTTAMAGGAVAKEKDAITSKIHTSTATLTTKSADALTSTLSHPHIRGSTEYRGLRETYTDDKDIYLITDEDDGSKFTDAEATTLGYSSAQSTHPTQLSVSTSEATYSSSGVQVETTFTKSRSKDDQDQATLFSPPGINKEPAQGSGQSSLYVSPTEKEEEGSGSADDEDLVFPKEYGVRADMKPILASELTKSVLGYDYDSKNRFQTIKEIQSSENDGVPTNSSIEIYKEAGFSKTDDRTAHINTQKSELKLTSPRMFTRREFSKYDDSGSDNRSQTRYSTVTADKDANSDFISYKGNVSRRNSFEEVSTTTGSSWQSPVPNLVENINDNNPHGVVTSRQGIPIITDLLPENTKNLNSTTDDISVVLPSSNGEKVVKR